MLNSILTRIPLTRSARFILLGLGLCLLGLVVHTAISYRNLRQLAENNRLVTHTQEVLIELETIQSTLTDAETGQRGYLLTGQAEYLKPYNGALKRVNGDLKKLQDLIADNPQQQERLAQLETKVLAKLSELGSTIQLYNNQNAAAALALVKSGQGHKEMEGIRETIRVMNREELDLLDGRRRQSQQRIGQSLLTLFLASTGMLVVLFATAVGTWQHFKFRQKSEEQIRGERKWLEVTLGSIGDAVLATDNDGRVVFMNPTAESLTAWTAADARGKPLNDVFRIVNEKTRSTVDSPVTRALREGTVVGLANHTILLARDGTERPIDDSAAPIFDDAGRVFGVVLVFRDATAQREAEQALQKLAAIVESSEDAIISKTMEGIITSWNPAAERLFGLKAAEAIGKDINIIVPEDRRDEQREIMRRLKAGEPVQDFDTVRMRRDGSRFPASLLISPIKDTYGEVMGTSKVLRDITERKKWEESLTFLARASRMLAALIDRKSALQGAVSMSVPFFADWCVVHCIDSQGNIAMEACAHRDLEQERLLSSLLERYPLNWSSAVPAARVLKSGSAEFIPELSETLAASVIHADPDWTVWKELDPRSLICVPISIRDRVVGAMTFIASSSSRRYSEKDVDIAADLASRVATAIDNAQLFHSVKEADRQKDEFLAMLAHELRNPLAAIQYATVLAQLPNAGQQADLFEMIDRQVSNLAHLIDDLLDISRISRDKIQLKREPIDAATVVNRAAAVVRPWIEQRRHVLTIDLEKEPMPLYADATRSEQIIANLLTNAAKYTPDGGQIAVRAYPENGFAVIKVKDTGIGLPHEMLPRVFDLFTQAERTLDRSEGGLGIGLTIVRKLAEMHGGSVSAASDGLGRGSEFTVRLPLSAVTPTVAAPPASGTLPAGKPLRILVVDDNRDTTDSAARLLQAWKHSTQVAYDGVTALEVAREFRPDVILLDIGLPGMNGYDVARSLRREGFTNEVLVAISGYGQADDRRRSEEAGFNHHLVKPIDNKDLAAILQNIGSTDATT